MVEVGSMLRFLKTCSKSSKAVNKNNTVGSTLRFLKTYCTYCLTVPFSYQCLYVYYHYTETKTT